MTKGIKLVFYNVNRVLHPIKINKIVSKLKKENVDITMLQETHLNSTDKKKTEKNWLF